MYWNYYMFFFFFVPLFHLCGKNTPQILTGRQCGFNTDGKQQQQQQRNHKDSSHSLPHLHSLGPPPPPCTGRRPAGQAVVRSGPRRPDSPCTPLWRLLTWAGCCTCSSPDLRCTAPLEDTSVKDKNLCYWWTAGPKRVKKLGADSRRAAWWEMVQTERNRAGVLSG